MNRLPEIYSLPSKPSVIDDNHIVLPVELARLLPIQVELELGDGGKLKTVRQEEVLSGKGLGKRLLRLGSLIQWEMSEGTVIVRRAPLDGGEVGGPSSEGAVKKTRAD